MQLSRTPSHRTTAYQTSDALVDHDSREKQFTVLRYHVHVIIGARIDNKITCGIQTDKGSPFQAYLPKFPLLSVSPVITAWLISLINTSAK